MNTTKILFFSFALATTTFGGNATISTDCDSCPSHSHKHHQHNDLTPIGVMGAHVHEAGEFMISMRSMYMTMERNFIDSNDVSDRSILGPPNGESFPIVPTDMNMWMHMVGVMYAPTNKLTLMAMVPYIQKNMNHITVRGDRFTTNTEGFGDVSLGATYAVFETQQDQFLAGLSLGLPTGSTDERGNIRNPMNGNVMNVQLPYPMQLGSGSYSLRPRLTWTRHTDQWNFGAQLGATLYLDENNDGYQLGDSAELTTWVSRSLNDHVSVSFRLRGTTWGDISGEDSRLNPGAVPTARTDLRGGSRIDALAGMNFYATEEMTIGLEVGKTVYQNLDGPQLGSDWSAQLGIQYSW